MLNVKKGDEVAHNGLLSVVKEVRGEKAFLKAGPYGGDHYWAPVADLAPAGDVTPEHAAYLDGLKKGL